MSNINLNLMKEQHSESLRRALAQLPEYAPPEAVWAGIESQLAAPGGKTRLKEVLPEYAPPLGTWAAIEQTLARDEQEQPLKQALQQLPEYEPADTVWPRIAAQLPRASPKRARTLPLHRLAQAAAAIALALALWWAWPAPSAAPPAISYAYAQEAGYPLPTATVSAEEQVLIQTAIQEFRQDPVAQQAPNYQQLLREWESLTEARSAIAGMMDRYGKDARLLRQLGEVERERAGLLKEMIAQI